MTKTTHPALEALQVTLDSLEVFDRDGDAIVLVALETTLREAIPALEALLAERDELLALLRKAEEMDLAGLAVDAAELTRCIYQEAEAMQWGEEVGKALAKHGGQS